MTNILIITRTRQFTCCHSFYDVVCWKIPSSFVKFSDTSQLILIISFVTWPFVSFSFFIVYNISKFKFFLLSPIISCRMNLKQRIENRFRFFSCAYFQCSHKTQDTKYTWCVAYWRPKLKKSSFFTLELRQNCFEAIFSESFLNISWTEEFCIVQSAEVKFWSLWCKILRTTWRRDKNGIA